MEVATLFFLALPLLILTLTIALFSGNGSNKKVPPGSFGWPVIGETFAFVFGNPEKFVRDRMKKYSPEIFKTNIFGEKTVVICGPNGHKFLFSNESKRFTVFRHHATQKLLLSNQVSPAQNSKERVVKAIRAPGFLKPEALVRYLGKMDLITQQQMRAHWEGKNEVKAYHLTKTLTLTIVNHLFLGIDDPDRIARLLEHFDCLTSGIHSIPVNFPGTIFYRAKKASARKELVAVINEKKAAIASGSPMKDILSHMIMMTDPFGKHMPEAEIANKIMGLLIAGNHNAASTMTFFMKYAVDRPEIYNKILAEQMSISTAKKSGGLLETDDVSKMKYSWNVLYEVMRLQPPIQGTFREALTDITYAGYTIPKGWKEHILNTLVVWHYYVHVYWTMRSTNKNPEYFSEPEKFDPSRFDDDKILPPFTFMPFGGGIHMCPDKEFARMMILIFVHNVVKRFTWELTCPEEKVIVDMMLNPKNDLPIKLIPHH